MLAFPFIHDTAYNVLCFADAIHLRPDEFDGISPVGGRALVSAQGYALSLFAKQTFSSVIDAGGAITASVVVDRSLPFATHFVAAVARCAATRLPSACQALANLCALTLYAMDHPACVAFQARSLSRPLMINIKRPWTGLDVQCPA